MTAEQESVTVRILDYPDITVEGTSSESEAREAALLWLADQED